MNASLKNTIGGKDYACAIARILQEAKKITSEFDYLLPKGWRLIVEERGRRGQDLSERSGSWILLDVKSGSGTGEYAAAEMATLKNFSNIAATRPWSSSEVAAKAGKIIKEKNVQYNGKMLGALKRYKSADKAPEHVREWLKDVCGLAPCYGGIRVPYEAIDVGNKLKSVPGELLLAFDGAGSEKNLLFVVGVLAGIQQAFAEFLPYMQISYDLRELRKIPTVRMWMELWGIKET